jgi:glucan 1,3-beta-glucosidase
MHVECSQYACSLIPNLVSYASHNLYTVSGEWSTAPTDCAKWLNGRGVGARWDGTWQTNTSIYFGSCDGWTGTYASFSDDYKTFLRKYWEVQVAVGEAVQGWSKHAFAWACAAN